MRVLRDRAVETIRDVPGRREKAVGILEPDRTTEFVQRHQTKPSEPASNKNSPDDDFLDGRPIPKQLSLCGIPHLLPETALLPETQNSRIT